MVDIFFNISPPTGNLLRQNSKPKSTDQLDFFRSEKYSKSDKKTSSIKNKD